MKKPLQVGDRVRIYQPTFVNTGRILMAEENYAWVTVKPDGEGQHEMRYHRKQLRRLRPKVKMEQVITKVDGKKLSYLDGKLQEAISQLSDLRWNLSNLPESP